MRGAPLVLLALLAPAAGAHGDGHEETYDPLALDLLLFATDDGALAKERPEPGSIFFEPGQPNAPHPPIDFSFTSPARLRFETEARVTLAYAADRPLAPADADGNSFEVTLLHRGEPTNATAMIKAPQLSFGVIGGGGASVAEVRLPLTALQAEAGDVLGLRIRPLMPVLPPDTLKLIVGGIASDEGFATRVFFPAVRVPTVQDLRLQDDTAEEFLLSADPGYRSGTATVYFELRVDHNRTDLGPLELPNERRAYLILRGVESSADAHAHHETLDPAARASMAHHYQVGDRLVRVHPGVGVRVPLSPGPDGLNAVVKCVQNCPPGGFERTIPLLKPDDPMGATGGTLIPPPRSTKGIPVSEDAPAEEEKSLLPGPGVPLVAAVLVLVALVARRQTKSKP